MTIQPAGRTVLFYLARCHDDLAWYLSIHPTSRLRRAANDDASNLDRLCLVKPVAE